MRRYALVVLHVRIQTTAAYAQLGKPGETCAWLAKALSDAEPDSLVMPFVEWEARSSLVGKTIGLGEAARAQKTGRWPRRRSGNTRSSD